MASSRSGSADDRPDAGCRRGCRAPVGRAGRRPGGRHRRGPIGARRHVRGRQRAGPLPVHVLPRGRRRLLRAPRGDGQQGRGRLADAAAEGARRGLRRSEDAAAPALRPRGRQPRTWPTSTARSTRRSSSSAIPARWTLFDLTRRLGHRVGLASWGGPGSADGARFDRLAAAFDVLDGAEAFVHPDAMAAVAARARPRSVPRWPRWPSELSATIDELPGVEDQHPLFTRIAAAWADQPDADATPRHRVRRRARALRGRCPTSSPPSGGRSSTRSPTLTRPVGWPLGDRVLAERSALESTRLAQRSIMARYVLAPVSLDVGDATLRGRRRRDDRHPAAADQHDLGARASSSGNRLAGTVAGWPTPRRSRRPSS